MRLDTVAAEADLKAATADSTAAFLPSCAFFWSAVDFSSAKNRFPPFYKV